MAREASGEGTWYGMWRRGEGVDRTWRAVEKEFVRACEAYLGGRYAAYLDDRGSPTPEWAWANILAHGSPDHLAALAAGARPHRYLSESTRTWEEAVSFLADEVLRAASAHPGGLPAIQREVLWPLENTLCRWSPYSQAMSPGHLVRAVTAALEGSQHGPTSGRRGPR